MQAPCELSREARAVNPTGLRLQTRGRRTVPLGHLDANLTFSWYFFWAEKLWVYNRIRVEILGGPRIPALPGGLKALTDASQWRSDIARRRSNFVNLGRERGESASVNVGASEVLRDERCGTVKLEAVVEVWYISSCSAARQSLSLTTGDKCKLSAIEVCDQFVVVFFSRGRIRVLTSYWAPECFCRCLLLQCFIWHASVLHYCRYLELGPRNLSSHGNFVFGGIHVQR